MGVEGSIGRGAHDAQSRPLAPCYPARTVRLVETRLLEGPNVYRLEPVVKLEVAVGRRRTWYGQRDPGRHALVHLGAAVPARDWPDPVAAIVGWIRRLRADHGEGRGGVGGPSLVGPGPLDRHLPVGRRRTGADPDRGGAGPRRARRVAVAARPPDRRPGAPARALDRADRGGPRDAARRGSATRDRTDPDRVDLGHQRQEHGHPADHPHPAAGRPARRDDDLGRGARRRADGRPGRLDRARRRAPDPGPARRRRGGPRDGARRDRPARRRLRIERRERADQRLAPTTSTCRASTRCPSWPRSSRRSAGSRGRTAGSCSTPTTRSWPRSRGGSGRRVALFTLRRRRVRRSCDAIASAAAARTWSATARSSRPTAPAETAIVDVADVPITIGGLARHNVANALAAAGGARGLGRDDRRGARRAVALRARRRTLAGPAQPVPPRQPGRHRRLRPQRGGHGGRPRRRRRASPRARPVGRRRSPRSSGPPATGPTTRSAGIGRIAAERAQRVAIKQTLKYLRGRTAESVVGELMAGIVAGGGDAADVPIYDVRDRRRSRPSSTARPAPARTAGDRTRRGSSC